MERVAEIAVAAVQHISSVAEKSEDAGKMKKKDTVVMMSHCMHVFSLDIFPELWGYAEGFTMEKVLAGIHYFRCHDYVELVALVNILPQFISQHPKVCREGWVGSSHWFWKANQFQVLGRLRIVSTNILLSVLPSCDFHALSLPSASR